MSIYSKTDLAEKFGKPVPSTGKVENVEEDKKSLILFKKYLPCRYSYYCFGAGKLWVFNLPNTGNYILALCVHKFQGHVSNMKLWNDKMAVLAPVDCRRLGKSVIPPNHGLTLTGSQLLVFSVM